MKRPKVLFIGLDEIIITTRSGKSMSQGIWDLKFEMSTLRKIKEIKPEYIFIETNQYGIGLISTEEEFEAKLDYVTACIKAFAKHSELKAVDSIYCSSIEENDPFKKPNYGMLEYMIHYYKLYIDKESILMVGNCQTDEQTAKSFNINYLDIKEFLSIEFI